MKAGAIIHWAIPIYLICGYVSAYRLARRQMVTQSFNQQPSKWKLWSGISLMCLMPLCALLAILESWNESVIPLLIGSTMNLFWFYAGCRLYMAGKGFTSSFTTQ
jgi:hypothetical protein